MIFQVDFLFLCMLVKCFNEHSHHLIGIPGKTGEDVAQGRIVSSKQQTIVLNLLVSLRPLKQNQGKSSLKCVCVFPLLLMLFFSLLAQIWDSCSFQSRSGWKTFLDRA